MIILAKAEGRTYARVWASRADEAAIIRWGNRQGYKIMRVKEGKQGDVQLSISGFAKQRSR